MQKKALGLPVLFQCASAGDAQISMLTFLRAVSSAFLANQAFGLFASVPSLEIAFAGRIGIYPFGFTLSHGGHAGAPSQAHRVLDASSNTHCAAFSAIISVGELVLPLVMVGMTPASTTRKPAIRPWLPRTRRRESTTVIGSSS